MQAVMYTLALKFLSNKDLGKVKEMIFMTELGQMLVDDGIEIGLAKGESKIVAMIRKKLAKASPFPPYPKNWNWTALTSKK